MTITDQQGRAIAFLLHEIRPDWPVASLVSLIDKHRDVPSLAALTIAATTKAMEATCKTPAPIFHPGPHWPEASRAQLPKSQPCEDHIGKDAHNCSSSPTTPGRTATATTASRQTLSRPLTPSHRAGSWSRN